VQPAGDLSPTCVIVDRCPAMITLPIRSLLPPNAKLPSTSKLTQPFPRPLVDRVIWIQLTSVVAVQVQVLVVATLIVPAASDGVEICLADGEISNLQAAGSGLRTDGPLQPVTTAAVRNSDESTSVLRVALLRSAHLSLCTCLKRGSSNRHSRSGRR
jgi:hypothetical protein